MRRNRAVRNQIESLLGGEVIDEIERWNDMAIDDLDHGVTISDYEADRQLHHLSLLAKLRPPEDEDIAA